VRAPSVGIVGGGILGLTAAYRLLQAGVDVALYERSNDLGGLVGSFDFDGRRVQRFYHVILPTDDRVRGLADEVGVGDRFRFRGTRVGFYDDGRLFSMSSLREFLTFPLLGMRDRLRLAAFVVHCRLRGSETELDDEPLVDWLRRTCGKRVVDRLWRPLLDSKFDGRFDDLPATYIWSRTRRMSGTRDAAGREVMGCLEGGYETLIDALAARVRELGGEIHTGVSVDRIVATGVVVNGERREFDHVLCTLAPPQARPLLDDQLAQHVAPERFRYLGVICVLLRLSRSVSPYYTLNITDRRVPLTTVVETTHVVDPDEAGGTLLYVTKYLDPASSALGVDDETIEAEYLAHLRTIFPDLRDDEILASRVQRARIVEPVHLLGGAKRLPEMFPVAGLALASTAHVYPENVNGQSVIAVADRVAAGIQDRLRAQLQEAA
jgi:protoporphyrinogen oxidase